MLKPEHASAPHALRLQVIATRCVPKSKSLPVRRVHELIPLAQVFSLDWSCDGQSYGADADSASPC